MFSYEFSSENLNWLPQNRCFVRGFRQFSSHLTKCHACHGICTLSPLDAALTMRFAKNTQHDTSKVPRLPHKTTFDTLSNRLECHKAPRLPRKTTLQPCACVDTFEKERFCSFPHRHGDATGKPETRDETRGSIKTYPSGAPRRVLSSENKWVIFWVLTFLKLKSWCLTFPRNLHSQTNEACRH